MMLLSVISAVLRNLFFYSLHVEGLGMFPKPLPPDEELECFKKVQNGDVDAKHKLIEHNLRLVAHIIKKYYSQSTEQDELISIGTIGLIKAVSTFDYTKGSKFATYASRCIENAIHSQMHLWNLHIYRNIFKLSRCYILTSAQKFF